MILTSLVSQPAILKWMAWTDTATTGNKYALAIHVENIDALSVKFTCVTLLTSYGDLVAELRPWVVSLSLMLSCTPSLNHELRTIGQVPARWIPLAPSIGSGWKLNLKVRLQLGLQPFTLHSDHLRRSLEYFHTADCLWSQAAFFWLR